MTAAGTGAALSSSPSPTRVGLVFGAYLMAPAASQGAPAVAVATIGARLNLASGATAWVLASFAMAMAVAMPLAGRLIDSGGARRVLQISTCLLVLGGLASAAAGGLGVLILGRVLAGAGTGAAFVATYQTIHFAVAPNERPRSLAVVAGAVSVASGCGPLIGGALEAALGWRAVVALPVLAVLAGVGGVTRIASRDGTGAALDWRGALSLSVAGAGLLTLLQARSTRLTDTVIALLLVVVIIACVALAVHVRRRPDGFVPVEVVRTPGFLPASFIAFVVFAGYFALLFAVPMTMRRVFGWSGPAVGLALTPAVLTGVAATRWFAAAKAPRRAHRMVIPISTALGLAIVALGLHSPYALIAGLAAAIVGFAGTQIVLVQRVGSIVSPTLRPAAVGLFNFMALTGGACGPAAMGVLLALVPARFAFAALCILPVAATGVSWSDAARAAARP